MQVTVAIKANGEIESVEINSKRANKVLTAAVQRIVQLSAPFAAFREFRADTDVLHITDVGFSRRADGGGGEK